jgi:hypothetical protein
MGRDDFVSKSFHFSTTQEDMLATPHIHMYEVYFGIILMLVPYLE